MRRLTSTFLLFVFLAFSSVCYAQAAGFIEGLVEGVVTGVVKGGGKGGGVAVRNFPKGYPVYREDIVLSRSLIAPSIYREGPVLSKTRLPVDTDSQLRSLPKLSKPYREYSSNGTEPSSKTQSASNGESQLDETQQKLDEIDDEIKTFAS